jgi:AGCS family alanine or glycine:cation symporter
MAWLNVIAILLLSRVGLATLRDYEQQRKSGQPLSFDPEKLGIRNAGLWKQINGSGPK